MEIISRKVLRYHGNCQPQGPTLSWKLSPVRYYNIMEIVSRKVLRDYGNYRRVGWERVAMFGGLGPSRSRLYSAPVAPGS